MAASKTTISNRALIKCGAKQVTAYGDGSTEDLIVSGVYGDCRDDVLMQHMWTFAQKRYALLDVTFPASTPSAWLTATAYAVGDYVLQGGKNYRCQVAHTSGTFATDLSAGDWAQCVDAAIPFTDDGMSNVYTMPSDLLKLNYLNDQGATYKFENMLLNGAATKVILANTTLLKIAYTYQNDDPTLYNALFIEALATRIAYEIAVNFSASRKNGEILKKEYEEIHLPRAISADSQQSSPIQPIQDEWEQQRFGNGMPTNISPGRQTWPFGGW